MSTRELTSIAQTARYVAGDRQRTLVVALAILADLSSLGQMVE